LDVELVLHEDSRVEGSRDSLLQDDMTVQVTESVLCVDAPRRKASASRVHIARAELIEELHQLRAAPVWHAVHVTSNEVAEELKCVFRYIHRLRPLCS